MNTKTGKIRRESPYARIDWNKAKSLFRESTPEKLDVKHISAAGLLNFLANAADKGIMFMFHADDPAIVEYLMEGTGPYNWKTRRIIDRFSSQHYVSVSEQQNGNVTVKITKQGMTRALTYRLDALNLKIPQKWDGKWRIVIFDIPNKYRRVRDLFRMRLKQLGLFQLQESIYVSPYKCFSETEFLRELYGVPFTVRYILAEQIENDSYLKRHFHLSSD